MNEIERLLSFTKEAVSPFHTVEAARKRLEEKGFRRLCWKEEWELCPGGSYYVIHHGSTLFAFTIGKDASKEQEIRMAAAHGDFPGFRIKPDPEMTTNAYLKLNTEPYGGVNLGSWLDRPLSAAGRVAVRGKDALHPQMQLVDFEKQQIFNSFAIPFRTPAWLLGLGPCFVPESRESPFYGMEMKRK